MTFKKFLKTSWIILLAFISMPNLVFAYSDYIIPGGENIGIELHADGVMIVGLYDVNGYSPGKEAGLKVGDMITTINGEPISTINDMVKKIDAAKEQNEITIGYFRNDQFYETTLAIETDQNEISKTGLYVKDSITGVGTLTFIDPETKIFGALGHEIIERSTGKILEIKDGKIYDSEVTGIIKSEDGEPGEKSAKYYSNRIQGTVEENTKHGIFGTYEQSLPEEKLYKVATPEEVKTGKAVIRTVLNGTEIKEYEINITKLNDRGTTKNMTFEITDPELLETTGGIIQGMSGSPILQDEYLIGAVTHVVVDSPTKGYGIFITNMLEEAENEKR